MIKVAIIIVNYNGLIYLPELLGSVFKFASADLEQEVIVVNNGSTDGSVGWIKTQYPQITLLEPEKNLGFAGGNNLAIKYAMAKNFDYVFLLNQDTVVTENYLDKLVFTAEKDEKIGAIQPLLMLYPQTDLINSYGNAIHYLGFGYTIGHKNPLAGYKPGQILNYCAGAACLIKISALKKIGLFKEEYFMYHEDLDLGWRLALAGYKNIIEPTSVVFHKYEFSRSIKKFYYMERNRYLVCLENYRLLTLLLILPALILMEMALFVFSFINGWWKEKLKVYAYFLKPNHWRQIIIRRSQTQKTRVLADHMVVENFSGVIANQEVKSFAIDNLANPFFNAYWQLIKYLIVW